MIQKMKTLLLPVSVLVLTLLPAFVLTASVGAQDIQNSLCTGANNLQVPVNAAPGTTCVSLNTNESSFNNLLAQIINVISILVGVVAVIMIIFGGFRYITSGGDATKVTAAKNTILYGLVGLIIVALSQIIVRFVLNQIT